MFSSCAIDSKEVLANGKQVEILYLLNKGKAKYLVTDMDGNTYTVSDVQGISLGNTAVAKITKYASGVYNIETGGNTTFNQFIITAKNVTAALHKATTIMIEDCLYSGYPLGAISDYKIDSISVIKKQGAKIDFKAKYDVKPTQTAYLWGKTDADGWIRGIEKSFTIYGSGGSYGSFAPIFCLTNVDTTKNKPQTAYKPQPGETVLYETKDWSYISVHLLTTQSALATQLSETEYIGAIYKVKPDGTQRQLLFTGQKDQDFTFFTQNNSTVYLNSSVWVPDADGNASDFYVIDLKNDQCTDFLKGTVSAGTVVGNTGYVFQDNKLIQINLPSKTIKKICTLPTQDVSQDAYASVIKFKQNNLYILFSSEDSGVYINYKINVQTGKIVKLDDYPNVQ